MHEQIAAFWAWWPTIQSDLEAQIGQPFEADLVQAIGDRVDAIHDGLQWEFGRGTEQPHYFCVTGAGDPLLHKVAERWRQAGPSSAGPFEFRTQRPRDSGDKLAGGELQIDGMRLRFADITLSFEHDEGRERFDVGVWHPEQEAAGPDRMGTFVYLALVSALGEGLFERAIGELFAAPSAPDPARTLAELQAAVDDALPSWTGERWVLGRLTMEDGSPERLVLANLALKRVDHPLKDSLVEITLPYPANEAGMPEEAERTTLDALEDALLAELADQVTYVGRLTGAGERQIRMFVDGDDDELVEGIRDRLEAWPRAASLTLTHDPHWTGRFG